MIRKNAISLILTTVVALTMLAALAVPVMNAVGIGLAAITQQTSSMSADIATTPAMIMTTNPSGGGNTGG